MQRAMKETGYFHFLLRTLYANYSTINFCLYLISLHVLIMIMGESGRRLPNSQIDYKPRERDALCEQHVPD